MFDATSGKQTAICEGRDGAVWLWDLALREEVVRLPGHKNFVWSLAFSPDVGRWRPVLGTARFAYGTRHR